MECYSERPFDDPSASSSQRNLRVLTIFVVGPVILSLSKDDWTKFDLFKPSAALRQAQGRAQDRQDMARENILR